MRLVVLVPLAVTVLAGCDASPKLDTADLRAAERASYLELVPLEPLFGPEDLDMPDETGLPWRAEALKARAEALRRKILTEQERERLETGVYEG